MAGYTLQLSPITAAHQSLNNIYNVRTNIETNNYTNLKKTNYETYHKTNIQISSGFPCSWKCSWILGIIDVPQDQFIVLIKSAFESIKCVVFVRQVLRLRLGSIFHTLVDLFKHDFWNVAVLHFVVVIVKQLGSADLVTLSLWPVLSCWQQIVIYMSIIP